MRTRYSNHGWTLSNYCTTVIIFFSGHDVCFWWFCFNSIPRCITYVSCKIKFFTHYFTCIFIRNLTGVFARNLTCVFTRNLTCIFTRNLTSVFTHDPACVFTHDPACVFTHDPACIFTQYIVFYLT